MSINLTPSASYKPPGDGGVFYEIDGKKLTRATAPLDAVKSQHLLAWYAKKAAMKAASCLVQGGLFPPLEENRAIIELAHKIAGAPMPPTPEPDITKSCIDKELYEFTENQAYLEITKDEALANALNWKSNMREAERYRDERARIGQLGHTFHHKYALGKGPTERGDKTLEWLTEEAMSGSFLPVDLVERFAERGWSREKLAFDHAKQTADRCWPLWDWFDDFKPDYYAVGLEAVVVNEDEEFAGQCDGWARFERRWWSQHREWPWPGRDEIDLLIDLKFTKSLPANVLLQTVAYRSCDALVLHDGQGILSVEAPPPSDAIACVHVRPHEPVNFQVWTPFGDDPANDGDLLADAYERGYLSLLDYWRWANDKPRPAKARRPREKRAARRTEVRECPI